LTPDTEPTLLVCDELGYLSLDQQTSNLFLPNHLHQRSTIITTNAAFSEWGNILYNTTIATAIADRLVENSEIFLLGGDSVRKANKNPNQPARVVPPATSKHLAVAISRAGGPLGNPSTARSSEIANSIFANSL